MQPARRVNACMSTDLVSWRLDVKHSRLKGQKESMDVAPVFMPDLCGGVGPGHRNASEKNYIIRVVSGIERLTHIVTPYPISMKIMTLDP